MRSGITLHNKVVRQQLSMKTVTSKMTDCMQIKTKQAFKGSQEGNADSTINPTALELEDRPWEEGRRKELAGTLAACTEDEDG